MLTSAELDRLAKDTGCSEHNDCLTCPFPKCIYDTVRIRGECTQRTKRRYAMIRQMCDTIPIADVAKQLRISVRTVKRVLKEYTDG